MTQGLRRRRYISVLQAADRGNLGPLIAFLHTGRGEMVIRFKDKNDDQWIAIWQSPVRFGASVDHIPDETMHPGIRFCNLKTGEEKFLEFSEEELPNAQQLEEMGDGALQELLERVL